MDGMCKESKNTSGRMRKPYNEREYDKQEIYHKKTRSAYKPATEIYGAVDIFTEMTYI
jgi:hypothetical protein